MNDPITKNLEAIVDNRKENVITKYKKMFYKRK